ncbi:DUF2834 domain-containing protein [Bdellovibrio bacteriovorus]|uniref:DUF2834 domain-containing protein n=1 Tax=Bdellovibrio bacteriovorus TaxID=959 RepID=UPI0005A2EB45|nr:DUF2834 domain-containing protein [Bdellovibrio bacteriovorus]
MRQTWIILAVLGTVVPFYFLVPFFAEPGASVSLFLELLFANSVSRFFAVDLVISSLAFLIWSFVDSRKNSINGWWMVLASNLMVGLSLALPLYFYKRSSSQK